MATVLDYRQQQYGLTTEQARDQRAESVLGRLFLDGEITGLMYSAGVEYRERHDAAMRAIKAPASLTKTTAGGHDGDLVTDDYVEWATAAVTRWEVCKDWARQVKTEGVLYRLILEDKPCNVWQMLGVRRGLSYLAKRMGAS